MTTGWKQSQPGPPGRAVQAGAPVAASPLRASRNWQVGGQWPSGWGGGWRRPSPACAPGLALAATDLKTPEDHPCPGGRWESLQTPCGSWGGSLTIQQVVAQKSPRS